jgi:hypothetical protein
MAMSDASTGLAAGREAQEPILYTALLATTVGFLLLGVVFVEVLLALHFDIVGAWPLIFKLGG